MALRVPKLGEKRDELTEEAEVQLSPQQKRPEVGRFLLQVDRQTKGSYPTLEAAEAAGLIIKRGHPIVRISVYDSLETSNKVVELPATT
jgi:hypothetical protein